MNPLVGEWSPLLKLLILWFHMWCHHGWSHHWMYLTGDSGSLSSSSSSSWHVQVISVSEIISMKNTTVILELQWCFLLELVCSPLWKRWDWCTCVNECFDLTVFVYFSYFLNVQFVSASCPAVCFPLSFFFGEWGVCCVIAFGLLLLKECSWGERIDSWKKWR